MVDSSEEQTFADQPSRTIRKELWLVHELGLQYFHDKIAVGTATAVINLLVGKVFLPQDSPARSLGKSGITGMSAIVVKVCIEGGPGSICQTIRAPATPDLGSPLSAAQASAASPENALVGVSLDLLPIILLLVLLVIEAVGIILVKRALAKALSDSVSNTPIHTSAS